MNRKQFPIEITERKHFTISQHCRRHRCSVHTPLEKNKLIFVIYFFPPWPHEKKTIHIIFFLNSCMSLHNVSIVVSNVERTSSLLDSIFRFFFSTLLIFFHHF